MSAGGFFDPRSSYGPDSSSPVGVPMIRKRTLQETAHYNSSSPLSASAVPQLEFDSSHSFSSPSTLASSPMVRNGSSSSSFYCYGEHSDYDNDTEQDNDDDVRSGRSLLPPRIDRPGMKRRRTAPDSLAATSNYSPPTPSRDPSPHSDAGKRGNGKDGQDVWPDNVENAFHEALAIIPKLGRKKVLVHGKPCGRNELIADYIQRQTGQVRSRKQVSSHIQVLKNMRKNDVEFMKLVSEPLDGEESFGSANAIAFFGTQATAALGPASSPMTGSYSESLLSPYAGSFLQRSLSVGNERAAARKAANAGTPTKLAPSSLQDSFMLKSAEASGLSQPMSACSSLTSAMNDMHFPLPPPSESSVAPCPITPVGFCLWADDIEESNSHIFAKFDQEAGPSKTMFLEDLPMHELRYPGLAAMHEHLPCQFLHVSINLDVLERTAQPGPDQLHAQVQLRSLQDLRLTAVTTIYSYGTQVISLEEPLAPASRLAPPTRTANSSANSSPASPLGPLTPGRPDSPGVKHKYSYSAPFASDFWLNFFRGSFDAELPEHQQPPASFAKSGDEREQFSMAVGGLSVVQEFVVRSEHMPPPIGDRDELSPGSRLGDVVLVVTYDISCNPARPAAQADVAFLKLRKPPAPRGPPPRMTFAGPPAVPTHELNSTVRPGQLFYSNTERRASLGKRAPLSLNIPPPLHLGTASQLSARSGPSTPWPQLLHTPTHPPPVHQAAPESNFQRDRLEQIWAQNASTEWDLNSPALMGSFGHHQGGPHSAYGGSMQGAPRGSQAMADMTTSAIAAGTPLLSTFPHHIPGAHGAPFIHPSHGFSVRTEDQFDHDLQRERLAAPHQPSPHEPPRVDVDYFSGMLNNSASRRW